MSVREQEPVRQEFGPISAQRILLVEDNHAFSEAVARQLAQVGHFPIKVSHGADALVRHKDADVVLLDLLLPDGHGLDVLRALRAVTDVPILVLTAVGDNATLVRALQRGADDYLVKPFLTNELLARIVAVVRRSRLRSQPPPQLVAVRDVEIDLAAHRVSVGGADVGLTRTEFAILAVLAGNPGTAVSRKDLLDAAWGDADPARNRSLSVLMTTLRKKINRPGLIGTLHGFGYRLEV